MFKTIDYSFYRIAVFFEPFSVAWLINAISIISLVQSWNLFFLLNLIALFTGEFIEIDLLLTFVVTFLFILVNSFRFLLIKKFESLDKKWKHETDYVKKRKGIFLLIYLIISPILYVISALLGVV